MVILIILHNAGGLLNLCCMPFDGLLNRSVGRIRSPWLISVDPISSKDIHVSALVSLQFLLILLKICEGTEWVVGI